DLDMIGVDQYFYLTGTTMHTMPGLPLSGYWQPNRFPLPVRQRALQKLVTFEINRTIKQELTHANTYDSFIQFHHRCLPAMRQYSTRYCANTTSAHQDRH